LNGKGEDGYDSWSNWGLDPWGGKGKSQWTGPAVGNKKDVLCKFIKAGTPCTALMDHLGVTTCPYSHNKKKFDEKGKTLVAAIAVKAASKDVAGNTVLAQQTVAVARDFSQPPRHAGYMIHSS
jgi:hypothetical protein